MRRLIARTLRLAALLVVATPLSRPAVAEPTEQERALASVLLEAVERQPSVIDVSVHVEACVIAVLQIHDGSGELRLLRFGEIIDVSAMERVYAQDIVGMNLMFADDDGRFVSDRFAETLVDSAEEMIAVYGVEASFSTYRLSTHRPERGAVLRWHQGGGIGIRNEPEIIERSVTAAAEYLDSCRDR